MMSWKALGHKHHPNHFGMPQKTHGKLGEIFEKRQTQKSIPCEQKNTRADALTWTKACKCSALHVQSEQKTEEFFDVMTGPPKTYQSEHRILFWGFHRSMLMERMVVACSQLSNEEHPGCLGYIGDNYTTHLYRDDDKPL